MKPLILISNDDGIHSPGLKAAAEAVDRFGEVLVVAPSHQQSAMGGSLCGDKEDFSHPIKINLFRRVGSAPKKRRERKDCNKIMD